MMRDLLRLLFGVLCMLALESASGQTRAQTALISPEKTGVEKKGYFIVRSNVLSLAVRRPTLSLEKVFPDKVGVEVSMVQGEIRNFLLTDFYQYRGVLFRIKKYTDDFGVGELSPFWAGYFGTLWRDIHTEPRDGWLGASVGRDFTSHSVRAGGNLGISYTTKSGISFESLAGLGYGRYLNLGKNNTDVQWKSYLDVQVWLSVGYRFGK